MLNLDALGYDWSQLDPEIIESVVWAQMVRHRLLPGSFDPFTHTPELFAKKLPQRWQQILDEYRNLKKHEPERVRGVSAYWDDYQKQFVTATATVAGPAPVRRVASAQERVQAACLRYGTLRHTGSHGTINDTGVYEQAIICGSHNTLNLIVVWGGEIAGDFNTGDVYMPPGVELVVRGNYNNVVQHRVGWEQLMHRGRVV